MKLHIACKSCKAFFDVKKNYVSRMEMEDDYGTIFHATCSHCAISSEYHMNDVKATAKKSNLLLIVLGVIVLFMALNIFLFKVGFISLLFLGLPLTIYFIWKQQDENRIHTFNKHLITRKTPFIPKKKL